MILDHYQHSVTRCRISCAQESVNRCAEPKCRPAGREASLVSTPCLYRNHRIGKSISFGDAPSDTAQLAQNTSFRLQPDSIARRRLSAESSPCTSATSYLADDSRSQSHLCLWDDPLRYNVQPPHWDQSCPQAGCASYTLGHYRSAPCLRDNAASLCS